jgi:polyhydroxybutyrate depolymerase
MITVPFAGRSYGYHLPNATNPAAPAPVVLVLHALGIDGATMEYATSFSDLADTEGFIAVYPEGTEQPNPGMPGFPSKLPMWNSGGAFHVNGVDDVTFLADVLTDLARRANADPSRIYAVGMSNGGGMAYRLAAERPALIKAMAAVAGAVSMSAWTPSGKPMPVLHIHGTADRIVPYANSNGQSAIEDAVEKCARVNQCTIPASKGSAFPIGNLLPVEKWEYRVGPPGAEAILYRVLGGGHTWPQQSPIPVLQELLGPVSTSINATETIWNFLRAY